MAMSDSPSGSVTLCVAAPVDGTRMGTRRVPRRAGAARRSDGEKV